MKKISRPAELDIPSFQYGIFVAAELASEYDSSSSHPYRLADCIMGKLNIIGKSKIRKNPNARKLDQIISSLERKVSNVESTMRFLAYSTKRAKEDTEQDVRMTVVKTFLRWAMGINPKLWDQLPEDVRKQWKALAR